MVQGIYETGEYLERNPLWHAEESAWKVSQLRRMLRRHDLRPSSVCDVGCGAGEVLVRLQPHLDPSCELEGFDISPQAIELARPKANPTLRFVQGDPVDGKRSYDVVLVLDVVEHVEDCFGFLRRVRGLGRHTLVHFPLDLSAQSVVRPHQLMHVREEYGHVHYFSRDTALSTLRETGHTVVDSFYTARALEQPGGELPRRLARWPRKLLYGLSPDFAVRLLGGFSLLVLATSAST